MNGYDFTNGVCAWPIKRQRDYRCLLCVVMTRVITQCSSPFQIPAPVTTRLARLSMNSYFYPYILHPYSGSQFWQAHHQVQQPNGTSWEYWTTMPRFARSNIYSCVSGIGLNICPPGGYGIPHQQGKHTIGICGIVDGDLDETAVDRIHGRFPELFRIHFP